MKGTPIDKSFLLEGKPHSLVIFLHVMFSTESGLVGSTLFIPRERNKGRLSRQVGQAELGMVSLAGHLAYRVNTVGT